MASPPHFGQVPNADPPGVLVPLPSLIAGPSRLAIAFLAALLYSPGLCAGASSIREITTVEVVEVPVYVTDDGKPVTGLTRKNFELFVNGRPQSIDYFDVTDFGQLSTDEAPILRQRRLYFLLFDLSSEPFALLRAQRAVDKFVTEGVTESDVIAVGTVGGGGLSVVVPFTRDRQAVRWAIRNFRAEVADPLRLAFATETAGGSFASGLEANSRDDFTAETLQQQGVVIDSTEESISARQARRVNRTIGAFGQLAKQLAALEGHKHVVLFSTGFDTSAVLGKRTVRPISNIQHGPLKSIDELMPPTPSRGAPKVSPRLVAAFEKLATQYASASVFFDAIDIAGIRLSSDDPNQEGLFLLARTGKVFTNRNDIGDAIHALTEEQRVVYVLGFHAHPTRRMENRIKVRLKDVVGSPRLSYRKRFASTPATAKSEDALFLADILTNDIPQNGVSLDVSVSVQARCASLSITMPGRDLLAFGSDMVVAEVLIYVFSGETAIAFKQKQITIDPNRARALEHQRFGLRDSFDLAPGTYTAKVLLLIQNMDARGFARAGFTIAE